MKPFLSFFLWDFADVFYSIETLYKIFCWNFSSKCQISLFFQFFVQVTNDFISRCLFYFQKLTYISRL